MSDETKIEQEMRVRSAVTQCADKVSVLARCRPPRRTSDLTMVFLRGPREAVLALPLQIFDAIKEFDVEIVRSGGEGDRYLLVLAVTEALAEQDTQSPERRAKLRRRIGREEKSGPA
ncbi:MAG: hypothetical protein WD273_10205 [Trueperaceae bacterium]